MCTRVLVGERQRIAVDAVPGAELPLEVHGPQVVRRMGGRRDDAGVHRRAAATAWSDQPAAGEQVARGAHRRPGHVGVLRREPGEQLRRAPARVRLAGVTQERGDVVGDALRRVVRGAAAVAQRGAAAGVVAAA